MEIEFGDAVKLPDDDLETDVLSQIGATGDGLGLEGPGPLATAAARGPLKTKQDRLSQFDPIQTAEALDSLLGL